MEELRAELVKRDQELLTASAKLKALEDQNRDSQRHIRVLKDSLDAKEEHNNLLLADVDELRRNIDERNKILEKKSYQQRFGASNQMVIGAAQQDLDELQHMVDVRDKRINELQRKVMQLDNLLAERDVQLERTRARMDATLSGSNRGGANIATGDMTLINHLEETLRDKEKQVSILRDQRDRAEHELKQERDSHERTIKEYKMKLNSSKFEMDKLQVSNISDIINLLMFAHQNPDHFANTLSSIPKQVHQAQTQIQASIDQLA